MKQIEPDHGVLFTSLTSECGRTGGDPGKLVSEEKKQMFQRTGVCRNSYLHTLGEIGKVFLKSYFQRAYNYVIM